MSKRLLLGLTALMVMVLLAACAAPAATPTEEPEQVATEEATDAPADGEKPELSIVWFAWPPCEALGQLASTYPDATVTVDCIPIGQWHDQIFTDFAAEGGADLPILDSQWIGEGVEGGHLVDLTGWMADNMETDDYVPAALSAYGEYPAGSGQYYGAAAMADVHVIVYRKDIFESLSLEPAGSWTELLTQAQTIKESGEIDNGFVWFWCGAAACGDQIQVAANEVMWSFGGELWDSETYQIDGVVNSAENVEALEYLQELYKTGPEGAGNFTYNEVVGSICDGTSAMTAIWVGFGPAFISPDCAQSANLGFAMVPGEDEHFLSLGGMGISVSAYSDNQEAALAFLKWFQSSETQIEWVKLGGYSARESVLDSEEFLNAAPYNAVFSESYRLVKDFWNIPEYSRLLEIQGELLNLAVTGQMEAQEALDQIATQQQEVIDEAYPDGPPAN